MWAYAVPPSDRHGFVAYFASTKNTPCTDLFISANFWASVGKKLRTTKEISKAFKELPPLQEDTAVADHKMQFMKMLMKSCDVSNVIKACS